MPACNLWCPPSPPSTWWVQLGVWWVSNNGFLSCAHPRFDMQLLCVGACGHTVWKASVLERFSLLTQIMLNHDRLAQTSHCRFITRLNSQQVSLLKGLHLKHSGLQFVSPAEIRFLLFQCPRHTASDLLLHQWTLTKSRTVSYTWPPLCLGPMLGWGSHFALFSRVELSAQYPVVTNTFKGAWP